MSDRLSILATVTQDKGKLKELQASDILKPLLWNSEFAACDSDVWLYSHFEFD